MVTQMQKRKRINKSPQELMTRAYAKSATGKAEESLHRSAPFEDDYSIPLSDFDPARCVMDSVPPGLASSACKPFPIVNESAARNQKRGSEVSAITSAPLPSSGAVSILLTLNEVSRLLGVSRSTINRMERNNSLPGRVKIGNTMRYHRETIENYVNSLINK